MGIRIDEIVSKADKIVENFNSRNPYRLAKELDIEIIERDFKHQKGAYKVILNNRFVFVKRDLEPVMKNIVLLHEIGHDALHREEAIMEGGFREFNLFSKQDVLMEYEANVFAAQIALPDDEIIDYIRIGYDANQIAVSMNSDVNLVALKTQILATQGHNLKVPEHKNNFLKDTER